MLCALLDIVVKDEDDDAAVYGTMPIDDAQFAEIQKLIDETGADTQRFCKFMGVEFVKDIRSKDYAKATNQLKAKKTANAKKV